MKSVSQRIPMAALLLSALVTSAVTQWPHHVYREDWKERTCSSMLHQVTHRHVSVDMPPRLTGQWTSHRCEIRSGPQFVLRFYRFHGSRFESRLYHYADPDCNKPLYGFMATGEHRLLHESWVIPGTVEANYRLSDVVLVPYMSAMADWLSSQLNRHCKAFSSTRLKPFLKYSVLRDTGPKHGASSAVSESSELDCTSVLNFTLNELQLVRLETRVHHKGQPINRITGTNTAPTGQGARRRLVRELLLGDVHTDLSQRQSHRPTSFQEPLRDAQKSLCGVCSRVDNADELNPPRLGVHQGTLLSLEGEWVSTRCESRQYGQFLTRWLHFLPDGQSWEGRYDYYHDALCRRPAFTLKAKGSYAGGQESKVIRGSKAYSFKTTRLKVTPRDAVTVNTLNGYKGRECGAAGQWRRDKEQDVTKTAGCVTLGIRLPNLEQDLMRMEATHRKLLLYVSQRTSDQPVRAYHHPPPSAFQAPLIKCDAHDLDMSINSLPERKPHALAMTWQDRFEEDVNEMGVALTAGASPVAVVVATPILDVLTRLCLLFVTLLFRRQF